MNSIDIPSQEGICILWLKFFIAFPGYSSKYRDSRSTICASYLESWFSLGLSGRAKVARAGVYWLLRKRQYCIGIIILSVISTIIITEQ
jgi:hypothetical protein